jgi:hypothetical protein
LIAYRWTLVWLLRGGALLMVWFVVSTATLVIRANQMANDAGVYDVVGSVAHATLNYVVCSIGVLAVAEILALSLKRDANK